ncbi:MAG: NAD(P)-binding protein [Caulobacteraceae bacterium]
MTDAAAEAPGREAMPYDVVIVGAGPAGLAAAIRLKQLAAEAGTELSVAVLEKGSEVGAHILSGAVIDPKGLDELIPRLEGQGRAAGDAGLAGPVPADDAAVRHRHLLAADAAADGQPRLLDRLPGQPLPLAGRPGRGPGRGGLSRHGGL